MTWRQIKMFYEAAETRRAESLAAGMMGAPPDGG